MVDLQKLPEGYEFHHVGYATGSIERERQFFEYMGYHQEGELFVDPVQGISGCFLVGPGPRVELLENLPGSVTLTPWIDAGIKMYHFAYLVEDIDSAINWARAKRAKMIVEPVPAVAFGLCRISFVMFPNRMMLEFIEIRNKVNI
ncbi:VOC family protein [Geobacter sp. SVR]|uniref:VOC family protein n=1 Tax=Geobacter sp. SVR TaxID=2495594 RepID=UPI00143F047A|nr:VOC family protein [Geobacter sp. SVR]BCS55003.1 lactoylglutathione lyase [Geobacter sp. SVR]GCF85185.1 hypothetical protein GSbR_17850 [Geobacter sp. SVR]